MQIIPGRAATILSAAAFAIASCVLTVNTAFAQQKHKVVLAVPATSTKYTQQHVIDVGDVAGHQVRVYEIQRLYPADAPKIEGARLVESWTRGYSDYVELNGPSIVYNVYVLEGGDKIFARSDLLAQSQPQADGSSRTTTVGVARITGGTGKFRGIQGTIKSLTTSDIKAGVNSTQTEFDYWMGM